MLVQRRPRWLAYLSLLSEGRASRWLPGGGGEPGQYCEQVYVGVRQHACSEVGVLRLGAIVVGKDMAQWTALGVAYQRVVLDAAPDEKV